MGIEPSKFQENATNAVISAFNNGKKRYLIADETGLGKTIIARNIISKLAEKKDLERKAFIIYYFGSNLMLLDNTINEKLRDGLDWQYHTFPNRLGMMAGEDMSKLQGVHIYGFSANILGETTSKGEGKIKDKRSERSRYYQWTHFNTIVDRERWFQYVKGLKASGDITEEEYKRFINLFSLQSKKDTDILRKVMEHYAEKSIPPLFYSFDKYAANLKERNLIDEDEYKRYEQLFNVKWRDGDSEDITVLRKIFEYYTLEKKAPDLIIFDEFHRYDDVVQEFVKRKVELPNILFLSATPYNYYPNRDIDACAENEGESKSVQIQSFESLLDILNCDMKVEYEKFKKGTIPREDFSQKLKDTCIYRNERLSDGNQKYQTLPTVEEFTSTFCECIKEEKKLHVASRYFKLCSGAYSFPVRVYKEKGEESEFYQGFDEPGIFDEDYYREEEFIFGKNHKLKRTDNYWENLRLACIKYYNCEKGRELLWVPPTMPEYQLGDRFADNSSFTKLMVFSAYKMVPRAVSGIFSAYVSDDVLVKNPVDLSSIDEKINEWWSGQDKLTLAKLYGECICDELCDKVRLVNIQNLLKCLIEKLKKLDNTKSEKEYRLTAKYIVGSPYMCAARIYGIEEADEIRKLFNDYFNKEGIKQAVAYCKVNSAEELLDYCINGGLGAVLKEYKFSGGKVNNLKRALLYGTGKGIASKEELVWSAEANVCSKVHVYAMDCYMNDSDHKPFMVSCHYAERFNADYSDTGASETSTNASAHFQNCHNAFNSPNAMLAFNGVVQIFRAKHQAFMSALMTKTVAYAVRETHGGV